MVADAGMTDGSCEEVGLRLQILRHETTIAGTDATNLLRVYIWMLRTEALHALDDILCHTLTGCVHMSAGELLPKARSTTGVDDVDHIAQGGIGMLRIAALEVATRRRATTVVVHNHRILLRCIEMRGQIEATADGIATRRDEVPRLALAKLDVLQQFLVRVVEERRRREQHGSRTLGIRLLFL